MSLSSKDPAETINITFDFSSQYTTITNPAVTVYLKGTTTDLTAMKAGPLYVDPLTPNKVTIPITGGESGKQYDLRCTADTNTLETVVAKDILVVKTL